MRPLTQPISLAADMCSSAPDAANAQPSAHRSAKPVPTKIIGGYHRQINVVVKDGWRRANAISLLLALGLCALANVVHSFTLAVVTLILSIALPAALIPEGLRCWFRYRQRRDDGRLRATVTMVGIALYLYTLGVVWFAGATHRFAVHGWLGFHASHAPSLGRFGAVYLYHFANMIPLVSIPQTARWAEPIARGHVGLGVMVLTFEVLIIIPLIAVAKAVWKQSSGDDGEPGAETQPAAGAT